MQFVGILLVFALWSSPFSEAEGDDEPRVAIAAKIDGESPPIDGTLDHPAWAAAPEHTGFTQFQPDAGEPASQRTIVKIVYSEQALYVGARMVDSSADEIMAPLMHQDSPERSDWFEVAIDSYRDRRTAFLFGVNPRGVKTDLLFYNDNMVDRDWTASWDAATTIDEDGWTATIRIPLAQLRYRGEGEQRWGINFNRAIGRTNEVSNWAAIPPDDQAFVSHFGTLEGLKLPPGSMRFEAAPYVSISGNRKASELRSPLDDALDGNVGVGLDLQYGLSPRMTLSGTINPDFGQVQVDPAVVNLTAFETIFPERRPFFREGAEIFAFDGTRTFNITGRPNSFYSRRIGAPPEVSIDDEGLEHISHPSETDILGALKLSGQAGEGWSVGVLNALTGREEADYLDADGQRGSIRVAPLTNYFMGVLEKRFDDGETRVGVQAGAVNRFTDESHLNRQLLGNSYVGGLSFEHRLLGGAVSVSGTLQGSYLEGHADAVAARQRHPARYMQRPDADHLAYDPERTDLSGLATELSLARIRGGWTYSVTYNTVSPEFDVNEMGHQVSGDFHAVSSLLQYTQHTSTALLQEWWVNAFSIIGWDYGGQRTRTVLSSMANVTFRNNWRIFSQIEWYPERYDPRLTRGGPMAKSPAGAAVTAQVHSDTGRDLYGNISFFYRSDVASNERIGISGSVTYRPLYNMSLSLEPRLTLETDHAQYVTSVEDLAADQTFGARHVFSTLDLTELELALRARWTVSPTVNIQLYAQPLLSSGEFADFSEFAEPDTYDFLVYGEDTGDISTMNGTYEVTPVEGESFRFDDPDFLRRSLRANAMLEWEYHRGSFVHVAWQLNQAAHGSAPHLDPFHDYGELLQAPAEHSLMVKLTYWFGS